MDYFIFVEWAAYISAFATIVMFVTGILFFTKVLPFGTIQEADPGIAEVGDARKRLAGLRGQ